MVPTVAVAERALLRLGRALSGDGARDWTDRERERTRRADASLDRFIALVHPVTDAERRALTREGLDRPGTTSWPIEW